MTLCRFTTTECCLCPETWRSSSWVVLYKQVKFTVRQSYPKQVLMIIHIGQMLLSGCSWSLECWKRGCMGVNGLRWEKKRENTPPPPPDKLFIALFMFIVHKVTKTTGWMTAHVQMCIILQPQFLTTWLDNCACTDVNFTAATILFFLLPTAKWLLVIFFFTPIDHTEKKLKNFHHPSIRYVAHISIFLWLI